MLTLILINNKNISKNILVIFLRFLYNEIVLAEDVYSHIDSAASRVLSMLLDLDLSVQVEDEKKEGENSMCEAIRQIKAEGRAEGKQEIIRNMLTKRLSLEEIAELTGVALEIVVEIASQ